jgi:dihydrofolate synthase/folylpolyglutamate synthase
MDPISERLRLRHPQKIDLSLDRMRVLCAVLGDPQLRLPPVIHVAGTNGKGSTVAFIRAMAEAAGLRVHAYTSPHLVRFNERIRLAGRLIEDEAAQPHPRPDRGVRGVEATVFESTTAAAFVAMSRDPGRSGHRRGRAGRHAGRHQCDRTPAAERHCPGRSGSCRVSRDLHHGIAAEKAGILKAGARGIVARQSEEAMAVIEAVAASSVNGRTPSPLTVMGVDFDAWGERGGMVYQDQERFLDLPAPA